MDSRERLVAFFKDHQVPFEELKHPVRYTMPEVAASLHVSGHAVAKVVIVKTNGDDLAMFVLSSPDRLDMGRVREILEAPRARLAKEEEFAQHFADCAIGAMPPFGNLYGIPVYLDRRLSQQNTIVFRAGSHQRAMRIAMDDYRRLVRPEIVHVSI